MNCPTCGTPLVIQNKHYYCPTDKIYIGAVDTYKPTSAIANNLPLDDKPIVDHNGLFNRIMKKWFIILIVFAALLYFTQDFYYIDFSKGCYIFISPSLNFEFSNAGVKRALTIIRKISPDNYEKVCQRVSIINTNISCGGWEGGCFQPNETRTIYVSAPARNVTWVAEVIAHETCHTIQQLEHRIFDEQECHKVGLKVMQEATVY
jgi:hypothetical protein